MRTGLVSVTFRALSAGEIVSLVREAGLDGIEWGGDVHCPPGDIPLARDIARLTRENGLSVFSYGSYYRAGCDGNADFEDILQTAVTLQAGNIRVWAGALPSAEADGNVWRRATEDTRRIADMAAAHGITVSFEYHNRTLTDTLDSAVRLLRDVDNANVYSYWQPQNLPEDENLLALRQLVQMNKLKNMHVFSWKGKERLALDARTGKWQKYLKAAARADPVLLMEFVRNDDPEQFMTDAGFLKRISSGDYC